MVCEGMSWILPRSLSSIDCSESLRGALASSALFEVAVLTRFRPPYTQVVAVDLALIPPAYSIELPSGVRETEADRLRPLAPQGPGAEKEEEEPLMRGHADAATAAKEAAARALEV